MESEVMKPEEINQSTRQNFVLLLIILIGCFTRLYFYTGHIFSDDAYYSYLSYTLLDGDFAGEYTGYPVFPLRIGFIVLTTFSMKLFGVNEFATIIFPFMFSLLNFLLVYKLTKLITNKNETAFTASFLIALFPTDIIFASIGFPDLINTFFINLGIYFLLKSFFKKKISQAFIGGFFFFISMQFKESIYYTFLLLIILSIYFLFKQKKLLPQLITGIFFILANYLLEGFVYLFLHNDFFYRITVTNINYSFSYYDFFPYTAQKLSGSKNYFRNIFDQIFLINLKSIFLRRFYLFLPFAAVIQTILNIKRKENKLLTFWFSGIVLLIAISTTSLTEYKPLDLTRSWYIYPVLMPVIILSSIFINRFSKDIRTSLLIIYFIGSIIMCFGYKKFFNTENLDSLKMFLKENSAKTIYTDHFTKYSVDLILNYQNKSGRISGERFNINKLNKGDWILFNKKHIEELQMQKFRFPDFRILDSKEFRKTASFNDFIFYEKL